MIAEDLPSIASSLNDISKILDDDDLSQLIVSTSPLLLDHYEPYEEDLSLPEVSLVLLFLQDIVKFKERIVL